MSPTLSVVIGLLLLVIAYCFWKGWQIKVLPCPECNRRTVEEEGDARKCLYCGKTWRAV